MAVTYRDATNKYDTSTSAINATANSRDFLDVITFAINPIFSVVNEGIDIIGKWISKFQLNTNIRRKDEQSYLLDSDKQGYEAESKVNLIVLVIVIIVIFFIVKKVNNK